MTNYQEHDKPVLVKMLHGKDKTLESRSNKISELQREIVQIKKEHGVQLDGFKDTPSLNIIRFSESGRPYCSEHGAMNCYDHRIYRCIMCGVAVCLEGYTVKKEEK